MSQFSYTVQIPNVHKFNALDNLVRGNMPYFLGIMATEGDPSIEFVFSKELTTEELATFHGLVDNYVDPEFWYSLYKKESMPLTTQHINTTNQTEMTTFIMTPGESDGNSRLESFKTVIEYRTQDVTAFANYDENTPLTVTLRLYCKTRNLVLHEETIDITDIALSWKAIANNNGTGSKYELRSWQIYGLYNKTPADYDCIWQFIGSVSDPLLYISLNGLQKIYYTINY
jgi:hypothetical protein